MQYVILVCSTALAAAWLALMRMVSVDDWAVAAYGKVLDNLAAIGKLRRKDASRRGRLAAYNGVVAAAMGLFLGGDSEQEISKLEQQNSQLRGGDLRSVGTLEMPGYALLRRFESIERSGIHKAIYTRIDRLYGRKHAQNKTTQTMAKMLSYPMVGMALAFATGAATMALVSAATGIAVIAIGTALALVLTYAIYDEIDDQAKKRAEAISRQFPNMVSKLALLVTSGMIMDRAWKETAYGQDAELYKEMQKTAEELDNLLSPEEAYSTFISRCDTKETAKLASAILQNLSKGNAELGALLREMAKEAWLERKHAAKRDSEKANSKLMIPTMLLFLAILIMIMVPIAMNFSSL